MFQRKESLFENVCPGIVLRMTMLFIVPGELPPWNQEI